MVTHVREDEYSVATHPVSGLCRFGHCGSHHCTCRQSVDACSHSIAVRDVPVSSGVVSKYICGELLNFRHGSAKITKGSSKEKVQYYASQGQILSFAITLFFVQLGSAQSASFGSQMLLAFESTLQSFSELRFLFHICLN